MSALLPATNILWEPSNNTKITVKTYHQDNYPLQLTSNQLGQLNKVYHNCISSTQYLPIQFTSTNSSTIFSLGRHVSELSSTPPSQSSHIVAQYSTSSLHLVYPLLVRPSNCQPSSSLTTSTITNKILPTLYQTDDSDNEEEEDLNNDLDSNNSNPQQDPFHPHLKSIYIT